METVLLLAAPIFALIGAGFLAGRRKLIKADDTHALNRFVFLFAMPAAVFYFAATNTPPRASDLPFAFAYLGAALAMVAFGYLIGRRLFHLTQGEAGAHAYMGVLGNAVFLGLPIAVSVEGWATPYLVLMLMEGVFITAVGAGLTALPGPGGVEKDALQSLKTALHGVTRNPIIAGMVLGFLLSLTGFTPPEPVLRFFRILGAAAGPVALFGLGATLALSRAGAKGGGGGANIAAIALVKLVALPGLTYLLLRALGAPDVWIGAAVLFTVLPSGVLAFVQASRNNVYTDVLARSLGVTTALSMITVSLTLALLAG